MKRLLLATVVALTLCVGSSVYAADGVKRPVVAARPLIPSRYPIYWIYRQGYHRVEYRVPAWVVIPAKDKEAAQDLAKKYRQEGWATQVTKTEKDQFVMKAQLKEWKLATYTINGIAAREVAGLLKTQGYQVRIR